MINQSHSSTNETLQNSFVLDYQFFETANMKVTSKNIIKRFTPFFDKRGFKILKARDGWLFFKIIDDRYALMYGNQISNRYSERFTFNICLLPTFEISLSLPDLVGGTTNRIAKFLTSNEREDYLPADFHKPGIVDGWWFDLDAPTVSDIETAIELTEPRFLNSGIFEKIKGSNELNRRIKTFEETIDTAIQAKIPIDPTDELFLEITKVNFEEYLEKPLKPQIILHFASGAKNFHDHLYHLRK